MNASPVEGVLMETASEVRTDRVPASATIERKQTKPVATRIWNFLISIKLAIWMIILLAVPSILGTVIQQNQPPEKYRQVYEDWAYNLMDRINLFDMYPSWWFLLLLCLFTLNLTCCTIDRLPRVIRTVRKPWLVLDDAMEKSLPLTERWKSKGDIPRRTEEYKATLARVFAAPRGTDADGVVHLYAEKGVSSRFGADATHAGIVIVFIGAIIGNVFGFKSYVNIPEGKEASHLDARGQAAHRPALLRPEQPVLAGDLSGRTAQKIRLGLERHGKRPRGPAQDDHGQRSARLQGGLVLPAQLRAGRRRDGAGRGQPAGRHLCGQPLPRPERTRPDRRRRRRPRGELRAGFPGEGSRPPGDHREARPARIRSLDTSGTAGPGPRAQRFAGVLLRGIDRKDVYRPAGRKGPRSERGVAGVPAPGRGGEWVALALPSAYLDPAGRGAPREGGGHGGRERQPEPACLPEEVRFHPGRSPERSIQHG